MEPLSTKKQLLTVHLYFSGLSFDQISAKAGISKGSVTNVVNELKAGNYPEAADVVDQIDLLRELSVELAKKNTTAAKAVLGISVLHRIFELNLDPADMERWPLLLGGIKGPDDAQELINAAYTVRNMEKEHGLSVAAVEDKVKKLDQQVKTLAPQAAKAAVIKKETAELNLKKGVLVNEISDLEYKLKWLTPRVQDLEQREERALGHHKEMMAEEAKAKEIITVSKVELRKLKKTGLSMDGLRDFNRKVTAVARHHGIKPDQLRHRLLMQLRRLDKGIGLETVVKAQQQTIMQLNTQIHGLKTAVSTLSNQKQSLEVSIKALADYVAVQVSNIIPVAQGAAAQVSKELQEGCTAALLEIGKTKNEAVQVWQDIGEYHGVLKESQWVQKMLALVRGEDTVKPGDVRTVALFTVEAISAWLAQHHENSPCIQLMSLSMQQLLGRLKEWET